VSFLHAVVVIVLIMARTTIVQLASFMTEQNITNWRDLCVRGSSHKAWMPVKHSSTSQRFSAFEVFTKMDKFRTAQRSLAHIES